MSAIAAARDNVRDNSRYAFAQSSLFLLIYNGCLVLTAIRPDVRRMFASWELSVPLVPAMIVPYLSMYFLFVAAFFLCRDRAELRRLSQRLTASQLVAALVYVLFPLESGYYRPVVEGCFGAMFRLIDATDLPYNLAPSLHVTTAIILGAHYVAKARDFPVIRFAGIAWFTLIAASTMLTWQHHLLDVVAGAMLGMACLRIGAGNLNRAFALDPAPVAA